MRGRVIAGALALAAALLVALTGAGAHPLARAARCPVLPADNPWNQRVDGLPVARGSGRLIAAIGLNATVHPDFGSGSYDGGPIGIPITIVSKATPRVHVRFGYASESDRGPYPIPAHPAIEAGSDRHVLLVDRSSCRDYELFDTEHTTHGWTAGSGAIFNLRSDHLRPAGWTSADAAGLAILPGLARYDDVARGSIDHALRFTASCTSAHYVYPARHIAHGSDCPAGSPPMGLRVRLKASVDIARLPFQARVVALALKRYGLILADNGSPWFISGAPDRRWNNDALHVLDQLHGSDFEVVDTSSLPHPGA